MMSIDEMIRREYGTLVGRKIVTVRPMLADELEMYGWSHHADSAMVIIFDDGTAVVPSADPEGNGPGCLFIEQTDKAPA